MKGYFGNPHIVLFSCTAIFCVHLMGQGSTSPGNDAFFLDLGIVIEPTMGNEETNRLIKAPPEKVSFLLDKAPSGSVFMASTKELQETLQRINERIGVLETAFHQEMAALRAENYELREMVSDLLAREPIIPPTPPDGASPAEAESGTVPPPVPGVSVTEAEELESQEPNVPSVARAPESVGRLPFNKIVYMNAVFAYQREDYETALSHFTRLSLSDVDPVTAGNILYWTADCYYQSGRYTNALEALRRIGTLLGSDKQDDAMILTGLVYRRMGEESRALQAFGEIIDLYPDSEYFNLAQMELRKSR